MLSEPITDRQREFIAKLMAEKALDDEQRFDIVTQVYGIPSGDGDSLVGGATRGRASEIIDYLLRLPRKSAAAPIKESLPPAGDVPEGRYAVDVDGVLKFYRVDRPTTGKYAGYVFVGAVGGPNIYTIKTYQQKREVMVRIAEVGAKQAMERYGQELGHCGMCGLPLTDETSRQIGIGPVCRGKEWYK